MNGPSCYNNPGSNVSNNTIYIYYNVTTSSLTAESGNAKIIVESGDTLTINTSTFSMNGSSSILVNAGGVIIFNANISMDGGTSITNNGNIVVNSNMTLSGSASVVDNGSLAILGSVSTSGGASFSGSGNTYATGTVTGSGTSVIAQVKQKLLADTITIDSMLNAHNATFTGQVEFTNSTGDAIVPEPGISPGFVTQDDYWFSTNKFCIMGGHQQLIIFPHPHYIWVANALNSFGVDNQNPKYMLDVLCQPVRVR